LKKVLELAKKASGFDAENAEATALVDELIADLKRNGDLQDLEETSRIEAQTNGVQLNGEALGEATLDESSLAADGGQPEDALNELRTPAAQFEQTQPLAETSDAQHDETEEPATEAEAAREPEESEELANDPQQAAELPAEAGSYAAA